jgi:hypothetical protein
MPNLVPVPEDVTSWLKAHSQEHVAWIDANMNSGFVISQSDLKKLSEWKAEHAKACALVDPMKQGAIGGNWTFSFAPTNLGQVFKVHCSCGQYVDLSDYDSW